MTDRQPPPQKKLDPILCPSLRPAPHPIPCGASRGLCAGTSASGSRAARGPGPLQAMNRGARAWPHGRWHTAAERQKDRGPEGAMRGRTGPSLHDQRLGNACGWLHNMCPAVLPPQASTTGPQGNVLCGIMLQHASGRRWGVTQCSKSCKGGKTRTNHKEMHVLTPSKDEHRRTLS